jgi:hypothetical protein
MITKKHGMNPWVRNRLWAQRVRARVGHTKEELWKLKYFTMQKCT